MATCTEPYFVRFLSLSHIIIIRGIYQRKKLEDGLQMKMFVSLPSFEAWLVFIYAGINK